MLFVCFFRGVLFASGLHKRIEWKYLRPPSPDAAYMKDKFEIKIESIHAADRGTQENVHRLDAEALKNREVIYIDIASKKIPKSENQADIQEFK